MTVIPHVIGRMWCLGHRCLGQGRQHFAAVGSFSSTVSAAPDIAGAFDDPLLRLSRISCWRRWVATTALQGRVSVVSVSVVEHLISLPLAECRP